jgi:hypothetical protein
VRATASGFNRREAGASEKSKIKNQKSKIKNRTWTNGPASHRSPVPLFLIFAF